MKKALTKKRVLTWLGGLLLVCGLGLFIIASVGLSAADIDTTIAAPPGGKVTLPDDHPKVVSQKEKAERFLLASGVVGGVGVVMLLVGMVLPVQENRPVEEELEDEEEKP